MRHLTLTALLLSSLAFPASTALADELAITIYGNNRALVSDSRSLSFKNGTQTIELPGVSSQIQPETATFVAEGIGINEQNFDFDLLSPEKLMEKAVGSTVEIVRTNPGTGRETREKAKVLSVNNGVVIQIGNKIEVLRDDDIPTRVVFDSVPPNLRANPTLSVSIDSDKAGRRDANLTYLTGGLNWRADYVAVFDEEAGKMDLQGWATLTNNTKTTFEDADVSVIAGTVQQNNRNQYNPRFNNRGGLRNAGVEQSPQERVGDNYLYPLPGKITVKSSQTKQVGIVDAQGVEAAKVYEYRAYGYNNMNEPQSADVRIAFSNSRKKGLGEALPQGIFRVYTKDASGRSQFIGEDQIGYIPGGSQMALKIGEAFDVKVKGQVASNREVGRRTREIEMVYTVTNATDRPTTVFIRQSLGGGYVETDIVSESIESTRENAYTALWPVKVGAEGEVKLRFKVRQKSRW